MGRDVLRSLLHKEPVYFRPLSSRCGGDPLSIGCDRTVSRSRHDVTLLDKVKEIRLIRVCINVCLVNVFVAGFEMNKIKRKVGSIKEF